MNGGGKYPGKGEREIELERTESGERREAVRVVKLISEPTIVSIATTGTFCGDTDA
jgi:hypothetical protein